LRFGFDPWDSDLKIKELRFAHHCRRVNVNSPFMSLESEKRSISHELRPTSQIYFRYENENKNENDPFCCIKTKPKTISFQKTKTK